MRSTKLLCVALLAVVTLAVTLPAQVGYLYNTSFSVGTEPYGDPQDWNIGEIDDMTGVWRDTEDYNSAPASLAVMRIEAGDGGSFSQAFQNDDRKPAAAGETFTWEASIRVDSSSGGSFQLVCHFSGGIYWEEIDGGWVTLGMYNSATNGWQQESGTATVPSGATWGLFRVWTSGIIAYHVDDIKINGEDEVVQVEMFQRTPARAPGADLHALPRIYRPDGRVLNSAASNRLDTDQLAPGCYVITNSQSLSERLISR